MQKANLLFANTYFYQFDRKQWKMAQPYPPLGTIYAAAQMRDQGYSVTLFDTNLSDDPGLVANHIDTSNPRYVIIYDDGFNYLTKMCLGRMKDAAFEMIKIAKEKGCTVVISSSDSTDHDRDYLEAGADYVIQGEGEQTLIELIGQLEEGLGVSHVQGISYQTSVGYKKNPGRPVIKDLDQLAYPAWDLIDVPSYRKIWMDKHGRFALNIATTRGCPYKCNWCAKPIYGNRYNSRSPEHVIKEIQHLNTEYGVDYFWMCDDIFGLKPNWVQQFRDLKKEYGLSFQYKIQSRVDLMLQEDNLQALADSGSHEIWIGAESGSQKILDAMDKGTKVEQIFEATKQLKKKGIRVAFFLQFGYIGETMDDIRKTIKMVLDLMPDDIGISVSYPLPGTKFYERVKLDLMMKSNWVDSDDLDLMFKNTYSPLFYKVLQRYVHDRYRIKKGWLSIGKLFKKPFEQFSYNILSIIKMIYHIPQAIYRGITLQRLAASPVAIDESF